MYKISITDYFMDDICEVKEYIFRMSFSLDKTDKIYDEIMANIFALRIFPSMYPVFESNLRVLTVRNKYRVFYEINESKKEVIVHYVFGTEQDYSSLIH